MPDTTSDGDISELRLLAALREALDDEPVPPELMEFARQSLAFRTVDAELAQLTADSWAEQGALVRSRSAEVRILTFETADLTLELEVLASPATRRLVGQLSPPGPAQVTVSFPVGEDLTTAADEHGRFVVGEVPPGRVRLRCGPPEPATALVTLWFEI